MVKVKIKTAAIISSIILLASNGAYADCYSPDGVAGDQIYNSSYNIMQYCNDSNWIAMGQSSEGHWSTSGTDLYYNLGSVGIGTNTPAAKLDIVGSLITRGNFTLQDNATIGGTLGVTGATTLSSTLGVAGATTLSSTLATTGATTLYSTLNVSGATTLGSTLTVTDAATINSLLNVSGATTVGGTLGVTGATTLSTLSTSGAATLNSAAVNNNATVGGTLGVTGATTLSTLSTSGTATLNNAAITNNETIGGALTVSGTTTLSNLSTAGVVINSASGVLSTSTNLPASVFPALTGDVVTTAGSTNTTITADAVALGTDTTGNYVASVTAGNGITVTGTAAEGWSPTIAITAPVTIANGGTNNTSAYTSGSVIYSDGTKLTQDNSGLYFNASSNSLGINKSSPSYNLDVTGTAAISGATTVSGTLGVTGATTLGSTLGVTGNTTIGGTLGATGATALGSTLYVSGVITANDAIKLSTTATACTEEGLIRYNTTKQSIETCNGTDWKAAKAGGFVPGSVPFANSDGDLTEDNTNFKWDDTNDALTVGKKIAFISVTGAGEPSKGDVEATINGMVLDDLGDVSTSGATSGHFLSYNGSDWISKAITLGTDTTGNYVSGITAGTGMSVTGTAAEGWSPTVGIATGGVTTTQILDGTIATADIANDAVTLGTKTSGNYVAGITAGTGLTVTGTAAEGWSPTVALTTPVAIANGGTNNSTAYTSGSVIFSNGTSLTQDNAGLYFNATNNRLGINKASPNYTLDVAGALNVTGSGTFRFNGGADIEFAYPERGDGGRAFVADTSDSLSINYAGDFASGVNIGGTAEGPVTHIGNSGAYTYFNSGNVGIGTTSPAYKLDIAGDVRATGKITGAAQTSSGTPVKICVGHETTGWTGGSSLDYVYLAVDTSGCGFTSTPYYIATVACQSDCRNGGKGVYYPTNTSFTMIVNYDITGANAISMGWAVNWIAFGN